MLMTCPKTGSNVAKTTAVMTLKIASPETTGAKGSTNSANEACACSGESGAKGGASDSGADSGADARLASGGT
jgi:hypothetical protein